MFLKSIEQIFKLKNVLDECKSENLLKPIGDKASNILVYNKDDLKDYETVKSFIIKEYGSSPMHCLGNFHEAKRFMVETRM